VNDAGFIKKGKIRNILDAVKLGRVHFGEGIERDVSKLNGASEPRFVLENGATYFASCGHNDLGKVGLLLVHPASQISILYVVDPDPLLFIELCLLSSRARGLCALRWARSDHLK
jgi:hypothetical protein